MQFIVRVGGKDYSNRTLEAYTGDSRIEEAFDSKSEDLISTAHGMVSAAVELLAEADPGLADDLVNTLYEHLD